MWESEGVDAKSEERARSGDRESSEGKEEERERESELRFLVSRRQSVIESRFPQPELLPHFPAIILSQPFLSFSRLPSCNETHVLASARASLPASQAGTSISWMTEARG